jgi:hypothetical protein
VCCEGLLGDDRTVSVWVGWGRRRVGSLGMCGETGQCVYEGVYETTGQCQCVCMGGGVGEDRIVSGMD